MTPTAPRSAARETTDPLDRTLRRLHRVSLAAVAACALFILTLEGGPEPPPHRTYTTLGVGLALATVVARRLGTSPRIVGGPRAALAGLSLAFAVGVAVVGALLAANEGARQTGLLFSAGAAIFCLRAPSPIRSSSG